MKRFAVLILLCTMVGCASDIKFEKSPELQRSGGYRVIQLATYGSEEKTWEHVSYVGTYSGYIEFVHNDKRIVISGPYRVEQE